MTLAQTGSSCSGATQIMSPGQMGCLEKMRAPDGLMLSVYVLSSLALSAFQLYARRTTTMIGSRFSILPLSLGFSNESFVDPRSFIGLRNVHLGLRRVAI